MTHLSSLPSSRTSSARCSRPSTARRPSPGPDDATAADLRVGDDERARTAALLGRAFTSGHLDALEYEQRLDLLYATRTHRGLTELTADLPVAALHRSDPEQRARRRRMARLGLAVHAGAAALAVVLCWLVWLVVALTAGAWYPWPVWPLLGAAVGVLSHALAVASWPGRTSARPPVGTAGPARA
jgi:hypothetical protein